MKGIILYHTKYGTTKEYALYLGEVLGLTAVDIKKIDIQVLKDCDLVVLGTNVRIGRLGIAKFLKKHELLINTKRVFIFTVSAGPFDEAMDLSLKNGVPHSIMEISDVFRFGGRVRIDRLGKFDSFIMKNVARMTKDPEAKKNALEGIDIFNLQDCLPLIEEVRKYL